MYLGRNSNNVNNFFVFGGELNSAHGWSSMEKTDNNFTEFIFENLSRLGNGERKREKKKIV